MLKNPPRYAILCPPSNTSAAYRIPFFVLYFLMDMRNLFECIAIPKEADGAERFSASYRDMGVYFPDSTERFPADAEPFAHLVGGECFHLVLPTRPARIRCVDSHSRFAMLQALLEAGFRRVELAPTWIHVDNDPDKPRDVAFYQHGGKY